jgi:hypothetical protein
VAQGRDAGEVEWRPEMVKTRPKDARRPKVVKIRPKVANNGDGPTVPRRLPLRRGQGPVAGSAPSGGSVRQGAELRPLVSALAGGQSASVPRAGSPGP